MADAGLEGYYNATLTGVDGRQYGYINNNSDVEQTIIEPTDGKSIETSLDLGLQQIVEKYVNTFEEKMGAKNCGRDHRGSENRRDPGQWTAVTVMT